MKSVAIFSLHNLKILNDMKYILLVSPANQSYVWKFSQRKLQPIKINYISDSNQWVFIIIYAKEFIVIDLDRCKWELIMILTPVNGKLPFMMPANG